MSVGGTYCRDDRQTFSSEYKVTRHIAVSGFVKNAFDKHYITNNRDDAIIDAGAPRTVGLVLRYDM